MAFVKMMMVMKVVLSVALLLLLASARAVDFEFMYFVQQWPGSYCDTHKCRAEPLAAAADFGIHGLWPNYLDCKSHGGECWPEKCNSSDLLDRRQIRDLVDLLNRQWPSLSPGQTNFEFWSHEWSKHGTCSNLGQHGYFSAVLALKKLHSLAAVLAGAGIVPSDEATYSLSSVSNAIAKGTGFRANLECNHDDASFGETRLYQVYQCIDRSGKKLIDCPVTMKSKCVDDEIKLPIFRPLHSADLSSEL